MTSGDRDAGLQPERTALAWRRTLLAIAVGALVSVRLLPSVLGDWTVAAGLGGVAVAAVLWVAASRRSRATDAASATADARLPGGGLLALLAVLTTAGALLGLAYLAAALLR